MVGLKKLLKPNAVNYRDPISNNTIKMCRFIIYTVNICSKESNFQVFLSYNDSFKIQKQLLTT